MDKSNPKIKPVLHSNTTCCIEETGWFLARNRDQVLTRIVFQVYENEVFTLCEFEGEDRSHELTDPHYVDEKIADKEKFYKNVAAGLEQLTGYLNRLLKDSKKFAALDAKKEGLHG